jgi:hypothetical protein
MNNLKTKIEKDNKVKEILKKNGTQKGVNNKAEYRLKRDEKK